MSAVLETRGLSRRFGGLVATNDVTFSLERGARQALIGPNGAGKTTFINLLTGVLPTSSGQVLLLDEPAAGVPEAERRDILQAIAALPEEVSVLLIEHDMDLVFSFARRISVLVDGGLLVEGEPAAIAADPRVRTVYLGEKSDG